MSKIKFFLLMLVRVVCVSAAEELSRRTDDSCLFLKEGSIFVIAECMGNNGEYTDIITDGLWLMCEESSWALPAHYFLSDRAGALAGADGEGGFKP